MSYAINKVRARTRTTKPSLTDQSQAKETDINVIVGRFLKTGTAHGSAQQPMSGDFTNFPEDLRGFIETAKDLNRNRKKLPKELRDLPIAELMALTPEQLNNKLQPPANSPAKEETSKTGTTTTS